MFGSPDMGSEDNGACTGDVAELASQLVLATASSRCGGSSGTSLGCSLFLLVPVAAKMLPVRLLVTK